MKGKTSALYMPHSELYLVLSIIGTKITNLCLLWTKIGVTVGYYDCKYCKCLDGVSVLGSQVFGQAFMESCDHPDQWNVVFDFI